MLEALEKNASIVAGRFGRKVVSGEVFAKVLTPNDDSGRHGVLVPSDVYSFFPDFVIPDSTVNATLTFDGFDTIRGAPVTLAYKYYERYPERRITRLNPLINDLSQGSRLIAFLRLQHEDGSIGYYYDAVVQSDTARFVDFVDLYFGNDIALKPGAFVRRDLATSRFRIDAPLAELLYEFDRVRTMNWVASMRSGDTGVGYTFETLIGIKENNSREADFKGIEIKCKQVKEGGSASGKINLFQLGPTWSSTLSGMERLRRIGKAEPDGTYSCYSQITPVANNLDLKLVLLDIQRRIDLRKGPEDIGYWLFDELQKRLEEKHKRAIFIKAKTKISKDLVYFHYDELVYCEVASIQRFVELVRSRDIVFEFLMSEKKGAVRNHGYPWRLGHSDLLDSLFSMQVKLR